MSFSWKYCFKIIEEKHKYSSIHKILFEYKQFFVKKINISLLVMFMTDEKLLLAKFLAF